MACNGSGVDDDAFRYRRGEDDHGRIKQRPPPSRASFPTKPFYNGNPWFMPIIGMAYQLRDRLDGWRLRDRAGDGPAPLHARGIRGASRG